MKIMEKEKRFNQEISYYDKGKGPFTLVFIHGSFINKEYWNSQFEFFNKDYRVITIDLPGHGNSIVKNEEISIENFGRKISQLLEKINAKNIILIGHSIGADVCLEIYTNSKKNISGFIAVDYFKNLGQVLPKTEVDKLITQMNSNYQATLKYYVENNLITYNTDKIIKYRIENDFLNSNKNFGITLNKEVFRYSGKEAENLKKIALKIYFLNVEYSPTNKEALENYLKNNFEIKNIGGTSHYPMIEYPKQFNKYLEEIIKKVILNTTNG